MSTTRFYDYWDNYAAAHESNLTQYLWQEDLTLIGKFDLFNNKNMKLAGRARFNTKPPDEAVNQLSSRIDYSLLHTVSPWTKYTLSQQSNELKLDGNFELYRDNHNYLSLFALVNAEHNEKKSLLSKLHLRYHHLDNFLLSLGIEQYDPLKNGRPDVYSFMTMFGSEIEKGYQVYGGVYSGFKISEGSFVFSKYLIALKHRDITGILDLGIQKVDKLIKDTELGEEKSISAWERGISIKIDGKINDYCTAGGDVSFNLDTHDADVRVYGAYDIDSETWVKGKWQCLENYITLAVNHNYKGFLNFGVIGKFSWMTPTASMLESPKSKLSHCLKSKFGLFVEFNDII